MKLGLPGVAMICLEWVSFEIAAFVLGSISEVELAANSIMINIIMVIFMVWKRIHHLSSHFIF